MVSLTCSSSFSSSSATNLSETPVRVSRASISGIDSNTLSIITSYFSIFECAAMNCCSIDLKNRSELCAWRPLAIRMNFSIDFIAKCGSGKNAIQHDLKEEFLAYHKFDILTNTDYCGITIDNREETPPDFEQFRKEIQNVPVSINVIQKFKDRIESIDTRKTATELSITCRDLTRLPRDLMFPNVTNVLLTHLNLQHPIPKWIFFLPKLQRLSLVNMGITTLSSAISHCTSLEELNINNYENDLENPNRIQELPVNLHHLPKLNSLLMNNLSLNSVPSELCKLSHLQALQMGNNPSLGTLPNNFANLQKLNSLGIYNIGLIEWPPALLELKELRSLFITNNKIKDIPDSVHKWLHQLQALYCRHNPWSRDALEILISLGRETPQGLRRIIHYDEYQMIN